MSGFKNEREKLECALFTDYSKIEKAEKIYKPNEDELKIITVQCDCSDEKAIEFFHKNKGNLEETIFDYLESNQVISKLEKSKLICDEDLMNDNISTYDKMETYRDILYKKDMVFQNKFDETSGLNNKTVNMYEFIAFQPLTTKYRKLKYKGSKDFFVLDIVKAYLEDELDENQLYENTIFSNNKKSKNNNSNTVELERQMEVGIDRSEEPSNKPKKQLELEPSKEMKEQMEKDEKEKKELENTGRELQNINEINEDDEDEKEEFEKKIVIKTLVKTGLNIARKWGCSKPVIAYLDVNEKDQQKENINELATKFMRKSEYFTEEQSIYGRAIVIDNWFL